MLPQIPKTKEQLKPRGKPRGILSIKTAQNSSGILFHIKEISDLRYKDKLTGYQAKLKYWGANHSKNQEPPGPERWLTNIKVEITLFEKMMFDSELREITHPYSDSLLKETGKIPCYNLKEVVAEKIRALVQRSYTAPRDYYDIYKLNASFKDEDWQDIKTAFSEKMEFKGLEYKSIDQFINSKSIKIIKTAWESSLKHQISKEDLPNVDDVINGLKDLFKNHFDSK